MTANANNLEGFNQHGYRDFKLPGDLNQIGSKIVKITQYCPALSEKSKSDSTEIFSKITFSEKVGDKWNNISFNLGDLDLFGLRLKGLREALLSVGGAISAESGEQG